MPDHAPMEAAAARSEQALRRVEWLPRLSPPLSMAATQIAADVVRASALELAKGYADGVLPAREWIAHRGESALEGLSATSVLGGERAAMFRTALESRLAALVERIHDRADARIDALRGAYPGGRAIGLQPLPERGRLHELVPIVEDDAALQRYAFGEALAIECEAIEHPRGQLHPDAAFAPPGSAAEASVLGSYYVQLAELIDEGLVADDGSPVLGDDPYLLQCRDVVRGFRQSTRASLEQAFNEPPPRGSAAVKAARERRERPALELVTEGSGVGALARECAETTLAGAQGREALYSPLGAGEDDGRFAALLADGHSEAVAPGELARARCPRALTLAEARAYLAVVHPHFQHRLDDALEQRRRARRRRAATLSELEP